MLTDSQWVGRPDWLTCLRLRWKLKLKFEYSILSCVRVRQHQLFVSCIFSLSICKECPRESASILDQAHYNLPTGSCYVAEMCCYKIDFLTGDTSCSHLSLCRDIDRKVRTWTLTELIHLFIPILILKKDRLEKKVKSAFVIKFSINHV